MVTTAASDDVFCRAMLNFAARDGSPMGESVEVAVLDARRAALPGWEVCGFERVDHRSAVRRWGDDEEIAAVHHAEMEQLARTMTGCDVALVSNHIKRGPEHARQHEDLAPISFVHSDFAIGYDQLVRDSYVHPNRDGPERAMERNGITSADVASAERLVILQFWRNLGATKMDFPLAFCDARTVTPDDARAIAVSDYAGSGVDFEAVAVLAPTEAEQYRWYSYPELHLDEAVAFRTYDTELVESGQAWFTPHSAFRDPDVPVGKPARSSIELRAVCLYA
jgi:hypothetical protein